MIFDEVQTARLAPGGRQEVLDVSAHSDRSLTTDYAGLDHTRQVLWRGVRFWRIWRLREGYANVRPLGRYVVKQTDHRFDMTRPDAVGHGGTFNNSPCTMAAGTSCPDKTIRGLIEGAAAIEHVATKSALARLNALGDELRDRVNEGFSAHYAPFKVGICAKIVIVPSLTRQMTGLGSLNQLHSTLPDKHDQTQAMELLYFRLLEKEIWIAQRGLISLSLVHEAEEVRAFGEALAGIGAEIAGLITKQWSVSQIVVSNNVGLNADDA